MGYLTVHSLKDKSELGFSYSSSSDRWGQMLALARAYGWKPLGTKPTGKYRTQYPYGDSELVSAADAKNLAAALASALTELPKTAWGTLLREEAWVNGIKEFIPFCKKGRFVIFD